jgi:hypothetical protein
MSSMKSKTTAAWLAFIGGPLGAHRFYLHGTRSRLAWLLPIPTCLGIWGIWRARTYGLDDMLSWILIPFLGFTLAGCALNAIIFGLSSTEDWNQKYNPGAPAEDPSGHTHWGTIAAIVLSLLIGTTLLMSSIVFSFQRYFEYQIEEARKISQ